MSSTGFEYVTRDTRWVLTDIPRCNVGVRTDPLFGVSLGISMGLYA